MGDASVTLTELSVSSSCAVSYYYYLYHTLTAEYQFIVAITTIIFMLMFFSSSNILSFNYIILPYLLLYLLYSGVHRVPDRVRRPAAAAGGCDPDRQR